MAVRRSAAAQEASARPSRPSGRSATRPGGARARRAKAVALHPRVEEIIAGYQPRTPSVRRQWVRIAALVQDAIRVAAPPSAARATQLLSEAAKLAAWRAEHDHDLAPEAVFSQRSINEYVAAHRADGPRARSYKARLEGIGRALGAISPDRPLPPLARTPVATPYTPAELATLAAWCDAHPGERSDWVRACIALGAGCGIDGREQHAIVGHDVVLGEYALLVRAPGVAGASGRRSSRPPRLVPVAAEHETALAALARRAGARPLIGATAAAARDLSILADLVSDGCPRLEGSRLRATWLAARLRDPVPLAALSAAGAGDTDRALAALAGGVGIEQFCTRLRGTRCCPSCSGAEPFDPGRHPGLARVKVEDLRQQLAARA